jgi:bifunctional N-acetylglucosamine-1-phosphate-uridyltransferase/glucosamine-1-phosphate-acetyltransferase GlmU-like protein
MPAKPKPARGRKGKIGPRTRVRDRSGLWGDHQIGADCTIARFVEIGDGVGDRCKVEAFASLPPGAVLEDDVFVPTRASPTTGGRGWGGSGSG